MKYIRAELQTTPTVAQLIEALSKQDPNARVLVSLPGEPSYSSHSYVATVSSLQVIKHLTYAPLNKDGDIVREESITTDVVSLNFIQNRDNMVASAYSVSKPISIVPV